MTDQTPRILKEVAAERVRQDEKWGEQNHPDFVPTEDNPDLGLDAVRARLGEYSLPPALVAKALCDQAARTGTLTYGHIALEEFCEAFEEEPDSDKLRAELVQTAAVLVAWIECFDRRRARRLEKLELKAHELMVGDLFEYVGSFATYKVESKPRPAQEKEHDPHYRGASHYVFQHSRDGKMIEGKIRLAKDLLVTVWRKKEPA